MTGTGGTTVRRDGPVLAVALVGRVTAEAIAAFERARAASRSGAHHARHGPDSRSSRPVRDRRPTKDIRAALQSVPAHLDQETQMRPHHPRSRIVALATVLTLAATACAGPDEEPGPSAPAARGAAFPVAVEHQFGRTEVPAAPQRVVSVGFNDHDTLLALGTTPVGVRDWYGEQPDATWPWAQDELGDADPTVLDSGELDVEAVAALEPDLIAAVFSGMTRQEYDLLSQIAPTIAQPAGYAGFGTPWREVTTIYGAALGVPDRAEQVIADVEARIEEVRAAEPAFGGATASVTFFAGGQLGAYTSSDLRSRLLTDLGFRIPQEIDDAAGEGGFFAPLSLEEADLVDRDVLVWITAAEAELAAVRELPVRAGLDAVREGREVFLPFDLNGAMSFSSPLSIPYLLDGLVPELRAAVDGDPATPVPSAGTS